MNETQEILETFASQTTDESRCSLDPSDMLVHIEFNLFKEANRLNIYEKYFNAAHKMGISFESFYEAINKLLSSHTNLIFDEQYLKPNDFKYFCELLNIPFKKLCDEYYKFVLMKNFPKIIKEKRLKLNLNQKELAARCNLSPVSIGKFENELKYPSRRQYVLLKEVIKL